MNEKSSFGASDRQTHPEGKNFLDFFNRLIRGCTGSTWERDILIKNKEFLWGEWKTKYEKNKD